MADQIDQLPYYDPLVKKEGLTMSNSWIAEFSSFIDTLNGYLSPFGDFLPVVTTAQRDTIQSPVEGQIIYNVDATPGPPRSAELQVWQMKAGVAAWRTITTVP